MENNSPKESWHLSRGVSLAHIISTFVLLGALGGAWAELKSDVQENETQIEFQSLVHERHRRNQERTIERIYHTLQKNAEKLDRLIERQSGIDK